MCTSAPAGAYFSGSTASEHRRSPLLLRWRISYAKMLQNVCIMHAKMLQNVGIMPLRPMCTMLRMRRPESAWKTFCKRCVKTKEATSTMISVATPHERGSSSGGGVPTYVGA